MKITKLGIADLCIIDPIVFGDSRGYFFETYNQREFADTISDTKFVQDNESYSTYGMLRGLHMQRSEHAQAKLVRVVKGEVLDVAVDVRQDSKTFGMHYSIILSEENKKQLFIPRGFLHGFVTLSEYAIFQYKCDNFYDKNSEIGVNYKDTFLQIDWRISSDEIVVNERDNNFLSFKEHFNVE